MMYKLKSSFTATVATLSGFIAAMGFVVAAQAFTADQTCPPPVISAVSPTTFAVPSEQVFMRIAGSGFQCLGQPETAKTYVVFTGPTDFDNSILRVGLPTIVYSIWSSVANNTVLEFAIPSQLVSGATPVFKAGQYTVDVRTPAGISKTVTVTIASTTSTSPSCLPGQIDCAAPPAGCSYTGGNNCSCGTLVCATPTPNPTAVGGWRCVVGSQSLEQCFASSSVCTAICSAIESPLTTSCVRTDCAPPSPTPSATPVSAPLPCAEDVQCPGDYRCDGVAITQSMPGTVSCVCDKGMRPGTCNQTLPSPTPLPTCNASPSCPVPPAGCFYVSRTDCSCGTLACETPTTVPKPPACSAFPVCGANGITYPTDCAAKADNVQVVYEGQCKPTETPVCPSTYAPACGTDGRTYDNACLARLAHASVAYQGVCKRPESCTKSDGYASSCNAGGENMVEVDAPFVSTDTAALEVGVHTSATATDAIWRTAYYYSNVQKRWIPKTLSGTPYPGTTTWLTDSGGAAFTMQTNDAINGTAYIVIWVYTYENGRWIGPPCITPPGASSPNPLGCWQLETLKVQ